MYQAQARAFLEQFHEFQLEELLLIRNNDTKEAKEMYWRLETAEQTASSSSRELQHTIIGKDGRRPATSNKPTNVSCQKHTAQKEQKKENWQSKLQR